MKRIFILPAVLIACADRTPWSFADAATDAPDASTLACETTTTCTLACASSDALPATFTTVGCENVAPASCVGSSDESESYGCKLSCDHDVRVVGQCANQTTP